MYSRPSPTWKSSACCRVEASCGPLLRRPGHADDFHVGLGSEEHTSELQSLRHLVCRLLLEKKKKLTLVKKPPIRIRPSDCATRSRTRASDPPVRVENELQIEPFGVTQRRRCRSLFAATAQH